MSKSFSDAPSGNCAAPAASASPCHDLDRFDSNILRVLQDDARITNVELAERIALTPPPCLRRVRRLEESGHILGYHAKLDAKKLGFGVTGFISVGLARQRQADIKAFERRASGWPVVRECHALNGQIDFLLKCVARDLSEFQHFVTDTLMRTANVKRVRSSFVIHTSKDAVELPLGENELPPAP
jgi:DNA-binding Lrp family transcriptional regulator